MGKGRRNNNNHRYREDTNPPGSGLTAITNQFGRPSKDDGNKGLLPTLGHHIRRISRDPQALVISALVALIVAMSVKFLFLIRDPVVLSGAHTHQSFRAGNGGQIGGDVDARVHVLDSRYFFDFYESSGKYTDAIDAKTGIDASYLAKNAEIAIAAAGTETAERMHGVYGYFADGRPSWTPTPLERSPQTLEDLQQSWKGYAFNSTLADSLPLDRPLPDSRPFQCKLNANWNSAMLPTASVGIVFHNENLGVLLRSIVSILNRTPPHLLREIILVDDASDLTSHPWLGEQLQEIIDTYPKVRLRREKDRQGLMMARIRAGEWARGDVVVFLDSHIEVTNEWLEPLLQTISTNPKTIVVPKILGIDGETLNLEGGGIGAITFSWSLGQEHLPDASPVNNYPSPAMAGGLFAANRKFFMEELGGYDTEMKLYGGEEFELGFKAWMCGGRIEVVPCSRIGHIFRKDTYWKGQVYKVPGLEIARNKRRVAHVWMDEYKDVALGVISDLSESMSIGPMEREKTIREHCLNGGPSHSFKWYLDNVATTVWAPSPDALEYFGAFVNVGHRYCFDSLSSTDKFGAYQCHFSGGTQQWLMNDFGELMSAANKFDFCANDDVSDTRGIMTMKRCAKKAGGKSWGLAPQSVEGVSAKSLMKSSSGTWTLWEKAMDDPRVFRLEDSQGRCVTLSIVPAGGDPPLTGVSLSMEPCDSSDLNQLWGVTRQSRTN